MSTNAYVYIQVSSPKLVPLGSFVVIGKKESLGHDPLYSEANNQTTS